MNKKIDRRTLYAIVWLASVVSIWNTALTITAQASEYSEVEQAYSQLVTSDLTSATVYTERDLIKESLSFYGELFSIDKEDTLYDGELLDAKSGWKITKVGENTYEITMTGNNKLTKATLDPFIDMLIAELNNRYDMSNVSKREKFYNIASFITDTYSYDYEHAEKNEQAEDVITAYYGSRKISCTGYALLLYLMCNKLGVDCELMAGDTHMYNIVRFSEDEPYYGVDLAATTKGYINAAAMLLDRENLYHPERISDAELREYNITENNGKEYKLAPTREYINQSAYYISNGRFGDFIKYDAYMTALMIAIGINVALITVNIVRRVKILNKNKKG